MGATVIAILVALRSAREARTAIFPIVKEEESTRARRARVSILVWIAVTAILLGGWLASLRLTANDETAQTPAVESGRPAESGAVEFVTPPAQTLPTDTVAPPTPAGQTSGPDNATPTIMAASPTPVPAISNPTPTETATSVPPTLTPTPPLPKGPAPAGTSLGPIEFSTELGSPIAAVNPDTVFPSNTKIYAVYPYEGMQNGITFAAVWYLDGVEIARDERPWEWGAQGRSYSFLLPPGEGQYKLELYANDSLLTSASFEVR